jgi:hypothetical protein
MIATELESTMWIERRKVDLEVAIAGTYDPGAPTIWRDSDGSGNPGLPPSVYNIRAARSNNREVELTAKEKHRAEEILLAGV